MRFRSDPAPGAGQPASRIRSGSVRPPLIPLTEAGQATALALLKQGAPMLGDPGAEGAR
jgi:hypothetical protein